LKKEEDKDVLNNSESRDELKELDNLKDSLETEDLKKNRLKIQEEEQNGFRSN